MKNINNNLKSTVIISVYTDQVALRLILDNLLCQKINNVKSFPFEIIISEDGACNDIKRCVNDYSNSFDCLQHLTQTDSGFRKNIALNRAIKNANTNHLIFIDGDCVPHPHFIAAHQAYAGDGLACSGRRLELGKKYSNKLRSKTYRFHRLTNRILYFLNMLPLVLDKAKNIESGIYSTTLQRITQDNETRLLGCNFSCSKRDLIKVNGFNEDYLAAGTGEDSDIDWRLVKSGVKIKKIKFSAIQYHLYHKRSYGISEKNIALFNDTRLSDSYRCKTGLEHIDE